MKDLGEDDVVSREVKEGGGGVSRHRQSAKWDCI